MEEKAFNYLKQSIDKATQKGAYSLEEVANILQCLEIINKSIQNGKDQGELNSGSCKEEGK